MLSMRMVERIKQHLGEGKWSQRRIARELGISRNTVGAVARGKHQHTLPPKPKEDDLLLSDEGPVFSEGPAQRCPDCGGKVRMPCLACRVRHLMASRRRPHRPSGTSRATCGA